MARAWRRGGGALLLLLLLLLHEDDAPRLRHARLGGVRWAYTLSG
jgi:hypothetical protein